MHTKMSQIKSNFNKAPTMKYILMLISIYNVFQVRRQCQSGPFSREDQAMELHV